VWGFPFNGWNLPLPHPYHRLWRYRHSQIFRGLHCRTIPLPHSDRGKGTGIRGPPFSWYRQALYLRTHSSRDHLIDPQSGKYDFRSANVAENWDSSGKLHLSFNWTHVNIKRCEAMQLLPISRQEYTRQEATSLTMRSMRGFSRRLHETNESLVLMMLPTAIQPWRLPLAITTLAPIPLSCLLVTKASTRLLLTFWSSCALQDFYCNRNDNDKSQQVSGDECCWRLRCW